MVKRYIRTITGFAAMVLFPYMTISQEDVQPIESLWKENWKVKIGVTTYRTNMLLHNGNLLIGSNGIDRNLINDSLDGIYVIDPKSGNIKHHIQHLALGDNDVNGLAINNKGTLFFGGDMQYIYAYETSNYTELWKYRVGADLESTPGLADLNGDGTEDVVFVVEGQRILALDGQNGAILWKGEGGSHAGNVSPVLYDLNGDGVKDVIAAGHSSYALDGRDGSYLWSHRQSSGMHASPLLIKEDDSIRIYTSSSYGQFDVFRKNGAYIGGVGIAIGLFSSPVANGQGYMAEGLSWGGTGLITFTHDPEQWTEVENESYPRNTLDIQSNFIGQSGGAVSASAISADLNRDGLVEFIVPSEDAILYITEPSSQKTLRYSLPSGAEATLFISDFDQNGSQTIFFSGLDGYLRSYEVGKTGEIVWPSFRGPNNDGILIK